MDPTFRNDGVGCSNHPSGTISSPSFAANLLALFCKKQFKPTKE
jgi:hypothetical protein